jgi:hypothetical protein
MNIFGMFGWWGLFTWLPAYLSLAGLARRPRLRHARFGTTFLVVLNLCGMFPGYLIVRLISDKFGRKRATILYLDWLRSLCRPFAWRGNLG